MKFALYDQFGVITTTGECPDAQGHNMILPGTMLYVGEAEMHDRIDVATGTLVRGIPPEPTYRELRRYPALEWQLDALWHAMDEGALPMAVDFYTAIKRVKDAHPNPDAIQSEEL